MDDKQMLLTMINMQMELDKAILESKGLEWNNSKCNLINLKLAILDEIGELNHELKAEWCWWKETQHEVDKQRVLEELVDIWHFAMMWMYRRTEGFSGATLANAVGVIIRSAQDIDSDFAPYELTYYLVYHFGCGCFDFVSSLIFVGRRLGFQIEDVFNAYIKKNKINYERLKAGY